MKPPYAYLVLTCTDIMTKYQYIPGSRRYFQHAHFIPIVGVAKRGEY